MSANRSGRRVGVKRPAPPVSSAFPLRRRLVPLAVAGGALLVVPTANPAAATVTGGCAGAGTIGTTRYDAAALDPAEPITVPEEGDVAYEGSVPLPGGTDRAYSGSIALQLPIGSVTVADWSGSSAKVADSGVHHYSIPALVPRGITVRVDGTHSHDGLAAPCTGAFAIALDGGPLDSPVPTAAALGGTLIAGAALASAAFPKGAKL